MSDVLVIAGTMDAKQIINKLYEIGEKVTVMVTTKLGSELIDHDNSIDIYQGKINKLSIVDMIDKVQPKCIIDASNPFSVDISRNVISACKPIELPYIRFLREKVVYDDYDIIKVKNYEEAYESILKYEGNIILTVGSKKIETFTKISDYQNRVYLRVLPDWMVLKKCEKLGFNLRNIIAMKGPFNEKLNEEIFKYCNASILVTKDSGNTGGVVEKINAARKLGIKIIMIERSDENYENKTTSIEEIIDFVKEISKK
ncbi:precorrin-6A reductase [Clostridium scatologenes]|uniref:Precorrin-6x reductase n=1 Tax=Clostridium scatologenes TaxID=1548 RepID=A0A0E3JM58_CLOSL|nr:precorrin-6A reductase [Clostridium scatologenes]AKA67685.1 precorrin-6x reductase [Clostridium scatologenes]